MCPELFHIGSFPIRGYGVMLALAFLFGVLYLRYRLTRDGKQFDKYLSLSYLLIFGGIIGSRLFYVITHLEEFSPDWTRVINPFAGGEFGISGLNIYGGFVVGLLIFFWFCSRYRLPLWETIDYYAPAIGIGLFFGRIGCFLNGCCFGTPSDLPWGVLHPEGSIPDSVFPGVHLHPAQIYSSLYGLLLFVGLHFLSTRQKFTGQIAAIFLMCEATFRFAIESFRFYETEMRFPILGMNPTYNHAIALALFLLGLVVYLTKSKERTNGPATP